MKRIAGIIFSVFVCGLFIALPTISYAADVNNFFITTYKIDYELQKNTSHHSILKTTESITAEFPSRDQNRGIERALPLSYDGRTTNLKIQSVTDENGTKRPYTTYKTSSSYVVRIGDPDVYVHGSQTYVINYTQQDVTQNFINTKSDEFYWDTNGTGWKVPIQNLQVNLSVAPDVMKRYEDTHACYRGAQGSKLKCDITKNENIFSLNQSYLSPGENITLAIGFQPGTFAEYEPSIVEKMLPWWYKSLILTGLLSIVVAIWLVYKYRSLSNRRREIHTIITQFVPPKDVSVSVSATVYPKSVSVVSAQLLDLAVRHFIQITEIKKASFMRSAVYELEIIKDIGTLRAEEIELLDDIFMGTHIGSSITTKNMKKHRTIIAASMVDNKEKLQTLVREQYQIRHKNTQHRRYFLRLGFILLILAVATISPFLLIVSVASFIASTSLWSLTDEGKELYAYLLGLKQYIKIAESDRLKLLQAPETAARYGFTGEANNPVQILKLYERLLPYAILFGQEKQWAKVIGEYYQSTGTAPDWFAGDSLVFNAAMLGSALQSFSSSTQYVQQGSSSSGGSSGGGFSGGGGGGGGGGGW